MSGFSFPPPPPPPPKAAQPSAPGFQYNESLHRGRGRGRGDSRGRYTSSRGQHRGDGAHTPSRGLHQNEPNPWPAPNSSRVSVQPDPHGQWARPQDLPAILPVGALVNPGFVPARPTSAHHSFRGSSPAAKPQDGRQRHSHDQTSYPSRTAAGHKRKLDALRGPLPEKKPAPATAPSVPSFGVPVVPSSAPAPTISQRSSPQLSKPIRGKSLGLVPTSDSVRYSSSDDEDDNDADEEAIHAELGDKLIFEHEGTVMSLTSQADLVAWKRERQKKWPTRARMMERDEERRKIGAERKRLLASAAALDPSSQCGYSRPKLDNTQSEARRERQSGPAQDPKMSPSAVPEKPDDEVAKASQVPSEQTTSLEALRRKVTESTAKNREAKLRKHSEDASKTGAPGQASSLAEKEQPTQEQSPGENGVQLPVDDEEQDASVGGEGGQADPPSDVSSEHSSGDEPDDDAPEEISSKPDSFPGAAARDTPPPKAVCKFFAASGYCRDGDACRYRHDVLPERMRGSGENGKRASKPQQSSRSTRGTERKGIHERLAEQERDHADRLALKVIKYLGGAGFFQEIDDVEEG